MIDVTSCDTSDLLQPQPPPPADQLVDNGVEGKVEESPASVSPETEIAAKLDKTDITVEMEREREIDTGVSCNILASEPPNNRNSVELKVN